MENKWIVLLGIFGMTISFFTLLRRYYSAKARIRKLEKELRKNNKYKKWMHWKRRSILSNANGKIVRGRLNTINVKDFWDY